MNRQNKPEKIDLQHSATMGAVLVPLFSHEKFVRCVTALNPSSQVKDLLVPLFSEASNHEILTSLANRLVNKVNVQGDYLPKFPLQRISSFLWPTFS